MNPVSIMSSCVTTDKLLNHSEPDPYLSDDIAVACPAGWFEHLFSCSEVAVSTCRERAPGRCDVHMVSVILSMLPPVYQPGNRVGQYGLDKGFPGDGVLWAGQTMIAKNLVEEQGGWL